MPSAKINISEEILGWVFKQVEYCSGNENTLETLRKWMAGEKKPTLKQVQKVSASANIPLGYFFLQSPPKESLPILEYRTVDSIDVENPSRELIDVIDDMSNIQEWMRDYQINEGDGKLQFIGAIEQSKTVKFIAEMIRRDLELNKRWYRGLKKSRDSFNFLRGKLEEMGVIVMMSGIVGQNTRRKLDINEFRAFTLMDDYAPLIFINSNDSENAKLFSLVHEAAHIWLGESDFYNDRYSIATNVNQLEMKCNAIAAEILVPEDLFIEEWRKYDEDNIEKIKTLSNIFCCGTTVIARRALDVRYIDSNTYNQVAKEAVRFYNMQKEMKGSSGGNYYNNIKARLDNRFLMALDSSVRMNNTSYTEAYRLTNLNRKTFAKTIDKVRGIDV